jgi:hypothetical protein
MASGINYKALGGIILVGHFAELDMNAISQYFPPHILSLMIDQLQSLFRPNGGRPDGFKRICRSLRLMDNGIRWSYVLAHIDYYNQNANIQPIMILYRTILQARL